MAIPGFQEFLLPVLKITGDGEEHSLAAVREAIAARFGLSPEDRNELLPSGKQRRYDNRVAWAKVHLDRAGLLTSTRRGFFRVTEAGRALLTERPDRIDLTLLDRYPGFREFRTPGRQPSGEPTSPLAEGDDRDDSTPEERLEQAYEGIRGELAAELPVRVKKSTPRFFEELVVELLLKMGYGRNRAEAGRAIGASGDEGIDGVISEDRLGLDTIYIQAKRWEGTVGRPEIQKFVGALHGKRARKGVFLTTGVFSAEARDYVATIDPRVVLIGGRELVEYMIDLNLGVTPRSVFEIKRIDSDYFVDE